MPGRMMHMTCTDYFVVQMCRFFIRSVTTHLHFKDVAIGREKMFLRFQSLFFESFYRDARRF